jgi:hypothetical protein
MAVSITDLPLMEPGDVADTDLLLAHRLIGDAYVPYAVARGAFLTGLLRAGQAASVSSLTAAGSVSGNAFTGQSLAVTGFVQIGSRITRISSGATATVTLTSLAAGASQTANISVADCLAGDYPLLSVSGAPAGVIVTAEAGAGIVTVRAYNATADAVSGSMSVSASALRIAPTPG